MKIAETVLFNSVRAVDALRAFFHWTASGFSRINEPMNSGDGFYSSAKEEENEADEDLRGKNLGGNEKWTQQFDLLVFDFDERQNALLMRQLGHVLALGFLVGLFAMGTSSFWAVGFVTYLWAAASYSVSAFDSRLEAEDSPSQDSGLGYAFFITLKHVLTGTWMGLKNLYAALAWPFQILNEMWSYIQQDADQRVNPMLFENLSAMAVYALFSTLVAVWLTPVLVASAGLAPVSLLWGIVTLQPAWIVGVGAYAFFNLNPTQLITQSEAGGFMARFTDFPPVVPFLTFLVTIPVNALAAVVAFPIFAVDLVLSKISHLIISFSNTVSESPYAPFETREWTEGLMSFFGKGVGSVRKRASFHSESARYSIGTTSSGPITGFLFKKKSSSGDVTPDGALTPEIKTDDLEIYVDDSPSQDGKGARNAF